MNTNKKCIVSFANSNGSYVNALARLSNSLRDNFDGEFLSFIGESSCGAPFHSENPYAFKIHCISKAIDAGYDKILWLDTSAYAVANTQPIFDIIEKNGFFFQEAGHMLGTWSNDKLLNYFEITRDEAINIPMVQGGFIGLDVSSKKGREIFDRLVWAMDEDVFKGAWHNNDKTESQDERCKGHRHEMSALSAIIHNMGLFDYAVKGDQFIQYGGIYDKVINDTIVLKCQGM